VKKLHSPDFGLHFCHRQCVDLTATVANFKCDTFGVITQNMPLSVIQRHRCCYQLKVRM